MRITTGTLGGRAVAAPKTTATRPMSDKVRTALFNILGDVRGAIILDAYAGSGAVGFEALSRGANRVVAVESGRAAAHAIKANQEALGLSAGYELHRTAIETWLGRSATKPVFDLIIADPPYAQLQPVVLEKLGALLVPGGTLVVSHSSRIGAPKLAHMTCLDTKTYGDTALSFYKLM